MDLASVWEIRQGEWGRADVRRLVEHINSGLKESARLGQNSHQLSLDQLDKVHELVSSWPEDEQANFLNMYAEELDAVTAHTNEEADRVLAEAGASGQFFAYLIAGGIAIFLVAVFAQMSG